MVSSLILHGALLLVLCVFPPMGTSGFKIKLIPRDSVDSPMYLGNLTQDQRLGKLVQLSTERAYEVASSVMFKANMTRTREIGINPDLIRPPMSAALSNFYVVQLSIGTPPAPFSLLLDSGSDPVWIQCAGCETCIDIKGGSYNYHLSSTFRWIPCGDFQCNPDKCELDACLYEIYYSDPLRTLGVRAADTFTFVSDNGALESIEDIAFGCGFNNLVTFGDNDGPENIIAGVFGMGGGATSFLTQLGQRGQGEGRTGRFSYCLPRITEQGINTYLHFGEDANLKTEPVISIPILPEESSTHYFVKALDISVEGNRLGIPPPNFALGPDGYPGFFVDSGAPLTILVREAYQYLRNAVEQFFVARGLQPYDGGQLRLDLCKVRPKDYYEFPTITFNFEGADFMLEPENAFTITDAYFCLMFASSEDVNLLGAFQQTNHRFLYDVAASMLSIAPEICKDV